MTKILALIPARMGSSRFPNKPLKEILGKPMIGHVYENIKKSTAISHLAVATCDVEIKDYIESIGGNVIMTSSLHERASDRCAEALLVVEKQNGEKYDFVVMIQGDEPMTTALMVQESLTPMLNSKEINITNLMGKIDSIEEFEDRNCIKVVCDKESNALYFSREPIPSSYRESGKELKKQICVISFRRDFLIEYTKMEQTNLENIESIDMLRILENGIKVHMVPTNSRSYSVDTIHDLQKIERLMAANSALIK